MPMDQKYSKHSTRFLISREDKKEETSSILSQEEFQQQSLEYMIDQRLLSIETAN